jgi:hypothetical protein
VVSDDGEGIVCPLEPHLRSRQRDCTEGSAEGIDGFGKATKDRLDSIFFKSIVAIYVGNA